MTPDEVAVNSSDKASAEEVDRIARAMMEAEYPPGTVTDGVPAPVWDEAVSDTFWATQEFIEAWRAKARKAVEWAVYGGFADRIRAEAVAEERRRLLAIPDNWQLRRDLAELGSADRA